MRGDPIHVMFGKNGVISGSISSKMFDCCALTILHRICDTSIYSLSLYYSLHILHLGVDITDSELLHVRNSISSLLSVCSERCLCSC